MKRHGGLWNALTSYSNLVRAAEKARQGKSRLANVARFRFDLASGSGRVACQYVHSNPK